MKYKNHKLPSGRSPDYRDYELRDLGDAFDNYWAKLIHFTDNGLENGTSLLPGFRHHSCWSAIGAASNGCIYLSASNHYQPLDSGDIHGNVALYKYDPALSEITLLGDIKATSSEVGDWMAGESQHKVHTFLMEHADGKLYFASDDYEPSYFQRVFCGILWNKGHWPQQEHAPPALCYALCE